MLVEQAIALIVNQAGGERVTERLEDALKPPDQEGTDLAKVRPARIGELSEARLATGGETGTSGILDEFKPARGISDGGDTALIAFGAVLVVLGLYLSRMNTPLTRPKMGPRRTPSRPYVMAMRVFAVA